MLLISLTFFIAATKHRLWHSNPAIDRVHRYILAQMVDPLMKLATFYLLSKPLEKIYLVWGAILMIAHGTLFCIADACTLDDSNSVKLLFIGMLTYNLVDVTKHIPKDDHGHTFFGFVVNLWVIWGLIILKTAERFFSFEAAKRTYGADSIYSASNYMRYQDALTSSDADPNGNVDGDDNYKVTDPVFKKGNKYIVAGEEKIIFQMETENGNMTRIVPCATLSDEVITVQKVWGCVGELLGQQMDPDNQFKDMCLSFALMKLLRRRFLNNPGELELIQESRASILQALLNSDDQNRANRANRVFRVIKTELGFLEDFFFSKYPIVFGYGLPIYNFLLSLLLMAATGWLVVTTYYHCQLDRDFYITYVLVAMILIMEITEITTYVLSDWTKVALLIIYVRFPWLQNASFVNTALRFFFKRKTLHPLREKIGQFSLLTHYGQKLPIRGKPCRATSHAPIKLPEQVKETIVDCLIRFGQGCLPNGKSSLQRNGKTDLCSDCDFPTSTQTILVWHIATCYCETKSSKKDRNSSAKKVVATALSKYCAYLVVSAPDLLPDQGSAAKVVVDLMMSETDRLLEGARNESEMWEMMEKKDDAESNKRTIAGMGVELGKKLMAIGNEDTRWKVLAEFWAEYVLHLAPSDNVQAHKEHLASGGEFITHLWVLLYHAGNLGLGRPENDPNADP
ncbi:hypothetical protein ZIOFF_047360 [Zingiber officinale]|uniref:DUF4220 domain-containing protein n=2 Tax=Zingiber officinale TaxID=94328 RepID=A0A8J5FUT1_ZINOF|nr:hypothetical protein ZIOFF_047360 [Zingiber officinale]